MIVQCEHTPDMVYDRMTIAETKFGRQLSVWIVADCISLFSPFIRRRCERSSAFRGVFRPVRILTPDARRICPPTVQRRLLLSSAFPPTPATLSSTLSTPFLFQLQNSPRVFLLLFHSRLSSSFVSLYSSPTPPSPLHLFHLLSPPLRSRYWYHYHYPRYYHRRRSIDGASSSAFSRSSPPAE